MVGLSLNFVGKKYNELYTEEFTPDVPPHFIFIPDKSLMRQMIIDAIYEM